VVGVEAGVISDEDRRLVVAVTVLSLALSPLWVITGRRLGVLAERGITSGTELLKMVYGPETEFVAMTLDKASSKTMWGLHAAALWLRRQRQDRKRRTGAGVGTADAAQGEAGGEAGGEAEIILPSTPANEDEPGGKKGATKRGRKDA
jgi:CPA2 family monovalent cation:H+ antiporter-2